MLLKNKKINKEKLLNYGFEVHNNIYLYSAKIMNNKFELNIEITPPNDIKTKLTDTETTEIYTLHLSDITGDFVGKIREEYNLIIEEIAENCFDNNIFKNKITYSVINYIKEKYGDEVEYLWKKFPDNAIARRKDNKKWYLAILTVRKDKLGFKETGNTEIIDLRANPEEIPELLNNPDIYPGYHMNKKHWITIILDGSVKTEDICKMIDKSYRLAK